jgi:hypothetical protein
MTRSSTHRRFFSEKGQTVAEFALVLPILAALLFAILEFGVAFNQYLTLTDAVRVGARKAAVSRLESDRCGPVKTAMLNNRGSLDPDKLSIPCPTSTWAGGDEVTVSASYPYSINVLWIVVKSGTMTSTAKERVE